MDERRTRLLRWFVGLSLILGALALLGGAVSLGNEAGAAAWVYGLVVLAAIAFVLLAVLERTTAWPWYIPAIVPVGLLMVGVVWAHFDPVGHLFLSGFAPFVAFLTGLAILQRRPWAWPVAFASVTGFGPTILLFAPLPDAAVYSALVLFLLDVACLLALAPSYFEPSSEIG